MLCPECGIVIGPGPLDNRRARCGGGTIDRPPALLRRLRRSIMDWAGLGQGREKRGECRMPLKPAIRNGASRSAARDADSREPA